MGLVIKILVGIAVLFAASKGLDWLSAGGMLPAFLDPVRTFLDSIWSTVAGFLEQLIGFFS